MVTYKILDDFIQCQCLEMKPRGIRIGPRRNFFFNAHVRFGGQDKSFRIVMTIFIQNIFWEGTGVDSDANRNSGIFCRLTYFANFPILADIAGINSQGVCAKTGGGNRQTVIKMNISDHRQGGFSYNLRQSRCRRLVRHRDPDQVTPRAGKGFNLS